MATKSISSISYAESGVHCTDTMDLLGLLFRFKEPVA